MEKFSNRLAKLQLELQLMREYGLNEDLLIAYLCHNLTISEKKAKQIIGCYEDFYRNFIKKSMLSKMTEDEKK